MTLLRFLAAAPGEAVDRDVLLREVWGYAPNVQSRAIDKTVHRLRTKLEIDPAEPWHLQGVRGLGYRLTGITLQEPDAPATNLRPSLAPAFGLGPTLVRLRERLTAPGTVVSLVGPPGSGKSRLATELGVLLGDDGWTCWLIPGGGCATAEALARAVCDELHTPWGGTVSAREAARRALARSGPVLVVVDDVGAVEPSLLLDGLLGATRWLLLARTAADTNDALTVRTSPLSPADGAALLLDRARRAGIDVAASPELEDIVIAVGGHAQTLELLAPRLAFFDAPALLASARAGVTGRGEARWARALELAVDSQWGALSSEEAGILARCAALTPPFSLAAALAVQPELDPERVVDALETAERRGVLVRADGGERRFSLPGPLRTRGLRHLAATGEEGRVTRLAEEHRVHEAEAFERDVREGRAARGFQGLERLRADLWSTVERWTQADPMFALRAAIPLALVQIRRGPPRYVALLNPLLDRPEVVPLRSRGRIVRAGAARRAGDLDSARAEARALADDPDPTVRAEAVVLLAGTAGAVGVPWAETIRLLEAALAAVDESSEPRVAVRLRVSIAIQRSWEGRLEESLFLFQAAEAWYRAAGDAEGLATVLNWVFTLLVRLGRSAEAHRMGPEVLEACRLAHDRVQEAWTRTNLGAACWELGALDDMRANAVAGARLVREIGDRYMTTVTSEQLAFYAVERGPIEEARHHFEALRRGSLEIGASAVAYGGVAGLGLVAHLEGRLEEAAARYEEALAWAPGRSHPLFLRWTLALRHVLAAERREGDRLAETRTGLAPFLADPNGPGRQPYELLLAAAVALFEGSLEPAAGFRARIDPSAGHEGRILACLFERAVSRQRLHER